MDIVTGFKVRIKNLVKYIWRKGYKNKEDDILILSLIDDQNMLKGKRIIVTGGSSGIGKAMAIRFVECGAEVIITGRKKDALLETIDLLNSIRIGAAHYFVNDVSLVTDEEAERLFTEFGDIDCLCNNAGISLRSLFPNVLKEDYEKQIATNFLSQVCFTNKYIELLKRDKKRGIIVNTASTSGMVGITYPYGISKLEVVAYTRQIAKSYGDIVRCNAIAPDITVSNITKWSQFDPEGNLYNNAARKKRTYRAEEVAEIALYLISDEAKLLSGAVLTCDNGGCLAVSSAG